MPEEGNKEMPNPEKSEFIINRDEQKIFGPERDLKAEYKNWLIDQKGFNEIKNEDLKTFIKFNGGIEPEYLTISFILTNIDKLHSLVSDGKIPETEADKLVPKLYEQLRNLTARDQKKQVDSEERFVDSMTEAQTKSRTREITLDLQKNDNRQREYIRELLDSIENSNRDSHDFAISHITNAIEASLGEMAPSLRDEVEARIAWHDCSELVLQANGWLQRDQEKVGYGYAISWAAAKAKEWHHDLTRKKIEI